MRTHRWAVAALCAAALTFTLANTADAQWRNGGRRGSPYGYGRYTYHPGYSQGFEDGYDKGREDARDRDRYDVRRHGRYRSADHGYNRRYGSRDEYRQVYREGFSAGYDQGYRDNTRGQRGWGWPGRWPR
jgi:flagellar biosynthesis/type III secretory pathway protein FliH